jgi:hypothetical protein
VGRREDEGGCWMIGLCWEKEGMRQVPAATSREPAHSNEDKRDREGS